MNIYFPLKKILKKLRYKIRSGQFKGVPVLKKANNLSFSLSLDMVLVWKNMQASKLDNFIPLPLKKFIILYF